MRRQLEAAKLLPPVVLLERLGQRLSLLTGGPQDAPARHRTLRATLDWSYQLLDEPAQRLFRVCSVFSGGASLMALEAVTTTSSAGTLGDLLDTLALLVDSSLLEHPPGDSREPRFTLLETIREYGIDRLAADGEEDDIRGRHAEHFANLVALAAKEPEVRGEEEDSALERVQEEHDNIRAALGWLVSRRRIHDTLLMATALRRYWCGVLPR